MLALALCHNVTPVLDDGQWSLQAASPDEVTAELAGWVGWVHGAQLQANVRSFFRRSFSVASCDAHLEKRLHREIEA